MTVSSVTESWSRKGGGYSSDDGLTVRADFTTAYQVVHDAGDSEDTILGDSRVPQIRDTLPGKAGIFCVNTTRQALGPIYSIVVAQWKGELAWNLDNPLNTPPQITWTNSKSNCEIDTDARGFPLTNVNGELVHGISKPVSDFTLSVRRNYASIDIASIQTYLDSTNSDTFQGWLPGTASLDSFSASYVGNDVDGYWDVSARIDFRVPYNTVAERAWWVRYRNDGTQQRVGNTTVTFTGGGAVRQATAYPIISAGVITGIAVTDGGYKYTSTPTVVITSTAGSGATATASMTGPAASKQVASVSVGSGGTGYGSRLAQVTDGNQQPTNQPVLLNATGGIERNAANAIWIERPIKQYSLPYSALGLV